MAAWPHPPSPVRRCSSARSRICTASRTRGSDIVIRTGYKPMPAEEWDRSTDHKAMHSALLQIRTTRKWYCYALACVRLIWDQIPQRLRPVIEVTERYVERRATNSDRAGARALCKPPSTLEWAIDPGSEAEWAVYWASAAPTDIGN